MTNLVSIVKFFSAGALCCLALFSLHAVGKTITLKGSGDAGASETIALEADAQVGVTVTDEGIVVTLPVNVRVKCYGDETKDGYCLLALSDGTGSDGTPTDGTPTDGTPDNQGALTPTFGSPTSQSGGFTVQVANYSGAYSWTASATRGSASINSTGLVTVTGLSASATSRVTVRTSRSGYDNGSASITGSAAGSTDGDNPTYCSNNQGAQCDANRNLDDMYGAADSYTVVIPAGGPVAYPFTLKKVTSSERIGFSLRSITDEAVLGGAEKIRAWISTSPGGQPISSLCDGYGTQMRGTFKFVQFSTNQLCSLPEEGGLFYVNWGVTCKLGEGSCQSQSNLYNYGSKYTFYLERFLN